MFLLLIHQILWWSYLLCFFKVDFFIKFLIFYLLIIALPLIISILILKFKKYNSKIIIIFSQLITITLIGNLIYFQYFVYLSAYIIFLLSVFYYNYYYNKESLFKKDTDAINYHYKEDFPCFGWLRLVSTSLLYFIMILNFFLKMEYEYLTFFEVIFTSTEMVQFTLIIYLYYAYNILLLVFIQHLIINYCNPLVTAKFFQNCLNCLGTGGIIAGGVLVTHTLSTTPHLAPILPEGPHRAYQKLRFGFYAKAPIHLQQAALYKALKCASCFSSC